MKKHKSRQAIGIPKEGASTTTEIRDLRKKELKKWNANKKMQLKSYAARKFRITVKEMENNDTFKEYIR